MIAGKFTLDFLLKASRELDACADCTDQWCNGAIHEKATILVRHTREFIGRIRICLEAVTGRTSSTIVEREILASELHHDALEVGRHTIGVLVLDGWLLMVASQAIELLATGDVAEDWSRHIEGLQWTRCMLWRVLAACATSTEPCFHMALPILHSAWQASRTAGRGDG